MDNFSTNRQQKKLKKLSDGKKKYTQRHIRIIEALIDNTKPKGGRQIK